MKGKYIIKESNQAKHTVIKIAPEQKLARNAKERIENLLRFEASKRDERGDGQK